MWPFRKKKPIAAPTQPEQTFSWSVNQDPYSWAPSDAMRDYLAQRADMQRRLDEQIARIAAMPLPRVVWTPVINTHGQVIALAWKNDYDTATWLLEEPAEGRA